MTTRVILDASATIRILTDPEAARDLGARVESATLVMAPALMLTEVANAIWNIERAGGLGAVDPLDLLHDAGELVDHVAPDSTLLAEALALAKHLDHPVYDCLYLVLARREVAELVSCDRRLLALAERVLP
jgi:predicted nucleic acid-binding protein